MVLVTSYYEINTNRMLISYKKKKKNGMKHLNQPLRFKTNLEDY